CRSNEPDLRDTDLATLAEDRRTTSEDSRSERSAGGEPADHTSIPFAARILSSVDARSASCLSTGVVLALVDPTARWWMSRILPAIHLSAGVTTTSCSRPANPKGIPNI